MSTSEADSADNSAAPHYALFDSRDAFQSAVDRLLTAPGRELRIFDPDLSALQFNAAARIATLEAFLRANLTRRLQIVLHDATFLTRHCPRMMDLLTRYAHAIQVFRTPEDLRSLQDAFLVLDAAHYVRRPVATFFRGALGLNDRSEALAMHGRFLEIWAASEPAVSASTLGL